MFDGVVTATIALFPWQPISWNIEIQKDFIFYFVQSLS